MRIAFAITLLLMPLLSACGFQPVYGKHNSSHTDSKVFEGVKIDAIAGRNGQQLHAELEDALNPEGRLPPDPAYRLSVSLSVNEVAIGVSRDATVSRYNLYFDSSYTLYRTSDNQPITRGVIHHVGSYNNAANAYFSTYVSRDDGYKRGISEVAELYRMRLSSYLAAGAKKDIDKKLKYNPVQHYPNPNWRNGQGGALGTAIPPAPVPAQQIGR